MLLGEESNSLLGVLLGGDDIALDVGGEFFTEGLSLHEDSVVLVLGLGQAELVGELGDGLLVGDDGVRSLELALGVLILEIVEADLDMELTASGDNVLTSGFGDADNEGIGLGESLKSLDELGEIGGVLWLDGDSHDWGDGVSHDSDGVGTLVVGDGSLLEDILVDSDESDGVTARYIGDGLDLSAHHKHGSLNGAMLEIGLGSWDVVGAHDSDLLASSDNTGEDSAEGIESTLIVGRDKLGDEDHQRSVLVAVLDGLSADIINGSLVEISSSVSLGCHWGGQLGDDHLEETLGSVEPLLEDELEKGLSDHFLLISLESNLQVGEHFIDSLLVVVHDVSAESDDW